MVQGRVDGTACEAFGYGSVFFSISSYMFSLCVALAIYLLVCKKVWCFSCLSFSVQGCGNGP